MPLTRPLAAALVPLLAAAALAEADAPHVAKLGALRAEHPWTRATTASEALVFVELENEGAEPVAVTGVSSPKAAGGALVGFHLVDGEPEYVELPQAPVEPGGALVLAPFGLALRLDGLTEPLVEGATLPVVIVTDLGPMPLIAEIEAVDAAQHSHAGHRHE